MMLQLEAQARQRLRQIQFVLRPLVGARLSTTNAATRSGRDFHNRLMPRARRLCGRLVRITRICAGTQSSISGTTARARTASLGERKRRRATGPSFAI
jgi:hypothetical protein